MNERHPWFCNDISTLMWWTNLRFLLRYQFEFSPMLGCYPSFTGVTREAIEGLNRTSRRSWMVS